MAGGTSTSRNAPCPCGSGKRYKHCCGQQPGPPQPLRYEALAAQRAGLLGRAESLYRRALDENPSDFDSLHMLGVVQLQRLRYREALELLLQAAEGTRWAVPDIAHNIGIVLGKLMTREANVRQADLLAEFVALEQARGKARIDATPLVSIVLAAHDPVDSVVAALDSVAAQTYRNLELVVIDDGSADGTAAAIADRVAGFPFPVRFETRAHRGTPAALNEGAALARGAYASFLDANDCYAPERIAALVDHVARAQCPWGFSLVASAARAGDPIADGAAADALLQKQRILIGAQPNSFSFVEYDLAVASGNLFVARDFFHALGGFRDMRYSHGRDFCLRASALCEPAAVYRPLYFHRLHAADTHAVQRKAAEDDRVVGAFLADVLAGKAPYTNELGPHAPRNRAVLLKLAFRSGLGRLLPAPVLRAMASDWLAQHPKEDARAAPAATDSLPQRKTAFIVLGMHRSGTSALSRVLNLCGAFIPNRVKPPKIGVNAKGFWEPEAVLELNVRVMMQLGGDWDRVDFAVPPDGEVVDEFLNDAHALLAAEYEARATIVIKDPRMCILAPLWHRALTTAGYRPVYVVPIRNPLEVAQSLHARGDMTVRQGLALWSAYMQRVAAFAAERRDVVYLRFTDLLDDWRDAIERIARRVDVELSAGDHADEVDRFLEQGLRTQTAGDADLAARCAEWSLPEVEPLYRASLARCDADIRGGVPSISMQGSVATGAQASAGFVLCIENNSIRDQALLLCESIRRYAGRHRDAAIMAFAPRPGLGVDADTRRRLAQINVEYIDEPLNITCREYAPANRVFAGAYAEAHARCDFLVVLDSDTVWLDEPELPLDADAAARPVDFKGSATRGPDDPFEAYWARMAALCAMPLERLPMIRSTIGHELIRASYNAGLTVVRRDRGILRRCAEIFAASVETGIRPYRGAGIDVYASTGHVGEAGSEYWGSSQTALALAIWSLTDRVVHYPDHYNVPLHLLAADSDIDPRWLMRPPTHLHYHWMFDARHHEVAMDLLARLALGEERLKWLAQRTPFRAGDEAHDRGTPAPDGARVNSPADRESRERTDPSTIRALS